MDQADPDDIRRSIESGNQIKLPSFELNPEDVIVNATELEGFSTTTDSGYAVAISTEISDELAKEGMAREFVHFIQTIRRSSGLEISDHIDINVRASDNMSDVLISHSKYIKEETLCDDLTFDQAEILLDMETIKIGDQILGVTISKTLKN